MNLESLLSKLTNLYESNFTFGWENIEEFDTFHFSFNLSLRIQQIFDDSIFMCVEDSSSLLHVKFKIINFHSSKSFNISHFIPFHIHSTCKWFVINLSASRHNSRSRKTLETPKSQNLSSQCSNINQSNLSLREREKLFYQLRSQSIVKFESSCE